MFFFLFLFWVLFSSLALQKCANNQSGVKDNNKGHNNNNDNNINNNISSYI